MNILFFIVFAIFGMTNVVRALPGSTHQEIGTIHLSEDNFLDIDITLPSGQAFRWKKVDDHHWRGVLGSFKYYI